MVAYSTSLLFFLGHPMLVLSRFPKEKLLIRVNDIEIEVYIVEVEGVKVRLGIEAPREVKVIRPELIENKEWER